MTNREHANLSVIAPLIDPFDDTLDPQYFERPADLSDEDLEILAWASMGANVFLGLRYSVWASADPKRVAAVANRLLRKGLTA